MDSVQGEGRGPELCRDRSGAWTSPAPGIHVFAKYGRIHGWARHRPLNIIAIFIIRSTIAALKHPDARTTAGPLCFSTPIEREGPRRFHSFA